MNADAIAEAYRGRLRRGGPGRHRRRGHEVRRRRARWRCSPRPASRSSARIASRTCSASTSCYGDRFRWHFIGALQSNKARIVDSICELVHAVETDSAARRLTIPALLEVNLSGEASKSGVEEHEIEGFLERHPGICGLMTMPPFSEDPEASRPTFRRLAELARQHGLAQLSMGTSQDWRVGVEEGATLIRVGSTLFRS